MNTKSQVLFKFYMDKCFVLPLELKNDLVYCQRSMRDFLKVHGLVSDVFKEQADADPVQMRRILDELEEEVYEINAEQQFLMISLNDQLENFYKKLHDNGIKTLPDYGSEYISNLLVPLISDESYKIRPHAVMPRDTEEMLIRKHFLVSQEGLNGRPRSPLRLSELDENINLMLVNDIEGKPQHQDPTQESSPTTPPLPPPTHVETLNLLKKFGEESITQTAKKCSSSVAVMIVPDSVLKSNRQPPPLVKKDHRSLLIPRDRSSTDDQPFLRGVRTVLPEPVKYCRQKSEMRPVKRLVNSPPPLAPIAQPQPTTAMDFERVAQSRINLRQALKRARKTKQQPRLFDDEDSMELTSVESTHKIKLQEQEPASATTCPVVVVPKLDVTKGRPTKASVQAEMAAARKATGPQSKQCKTRNAQGARKSDGVGSPPTSSSSSDDSNQETYEQQRSCMQWINEPRETRVQPTEYGQEQFLGLFALYTHDVVKRLNQRHSKRKRRTVQNANGVHFHYGEQLAGMDVSRFKKLKAKPEFLLSPKEKRLQEKKAHKAVAGRKSKSPDKFEEPLASNHAGAKAVIPSEIKAKCKECKKRTDTLLPCNNCHGYYHLNCHDETGARSKPPFGRCPPCWRKKYAIATKMTL